MSTNKEKNDVDIVDIEEAGRSKLEADTIAASTENDSVNNQVATASDQKGPMAYKEFFENRDAEKKKLYVTVMHTGLLLLGIFVIVGFLGLSIKYLFYTSFTNTTTYNIVSYITILSGNLGSSIGVCMVSTVPVNEFDIDVKLKDSPKLERVFSLIFGTLFVLTGIILSSFSPYAPGGMLAASGVAFLLHNSNCSNNVYCPPIIPDFTFKQHEKSLKKEVLECIQEICFPNNFSTKLFVSANLLYFATSILIIVRTFYPVYLSKSNWLMPNIMLSSMEKEEALYAHYWPFGFISALVQFSTMLINLKHYFNLKRGKSVIVTDKKETRKQMKGWRTSACFVTIRSFFLCYGIANFSGSLWGIFTNETMSNILLGVISSVIQVIPPLACILIGTKKCFTLAARYFEYDIDRLYEDGALLAALASSSAAAINTKVSVGEKSVWWIHRRTPLVDLDLDLDKGSDKDKEADVVKDDIQRKLWMKGDVIETTSDSEGKTLVKVRIYYRVKKEESSMVQGSSGSISSSCCGCVADSDLTWRAKFVDRDLQIIPGHKDSLRTTLLTFKQWCETYFEKLDDKDIHGEEEGNEYVEVTAKSSNGIINSADLKDLAEEKLRSFSWKNFNKRLFLKSPRELTDDREKIMTFFLSSKIGVKDDGKIDYFISHSWNDCGKKKCEVMSSFVKEFRIANNGRFPTFWFDKVCIDQNDSGDALLVLPLYIASSKQLLVLMSSSYVKRLWCIWEIFCLVTFCNKELALERIEVRVLEDSPAFVEDIIKQLECFDIDRAHCYDPNEEYKLRQIMFDIGIDKLKKCMRDVAETVGRKTKDSILHTKDVKPSQLARIFNALK